MEGAGALVAATLGEGTSRACMPGELAALSSERSSARTADTGTTVTDGGIADPPLGAVGERLPSRGARTARSPE